MRPMGGEQAMSTSPSAPAGESRLARWLPFLAWPRVTPTSLRADVVSGITVSLVAIPQSLAYAQLSGVPPLYGLYAAFIPSIVGALFGSSAILSTGPVALTSLLTAASVGALVAPATDAFYAYVTMLALLSGTISARLRACTRGCASEPRLTAGADGLHQRRGADHRAVATARAHGHLGPAVAAPVARHLERRVPPGPAARDVARVRDRRHRPSDRVPAVRAKTSWRADHRCANDLGKPRCRFRRSRGPGRGRNSLRPAFARRAHARLGRDSGAPTRRVRAWR